MYKILHTGDIHFKKELLPEIKKCTDFLIEQAKKEKVNLSIVAGDLFDEKQVYDSIVFADAIEFIQKLAEISPVYILRGTTSHDGNNLQFFGALNTLLGVHVADEIEDIQYAGVGIYALPPISKATYILDNGNSKPKTQNPFLKWGSISEVNEQSNIPSVLVGHLTVSGSTLSSGQNMIIDENAFSTADLKMTGADLVCLGHIHKAQNWDNIFYSGSITRLNFGEEEEKGFWIHELEGKTLSSSRFIKTPARAMVTLDLGYDDLTDINNLQIPADSHVRVRFKVSEENIHLINEAGLKEKALTIASEVKIEKIVIPKQRIRAEGISVLTLVEKLNQWGEITETKITKEITKKLHFLSTVDTDNLSGTTLFKEVKEDETTLTEIKGF